MTAIEKKTLSLDILVFFFLLLVVIGFWYVSNRRTNLKMLFFPVLLVIHSHILRRVSVLMSILAEPQGEDHVWDQKCFVYSCNGRMQLIDLWIAWKCHVKYSNRIKSFVSALRMNIRITLRTNRNSLNRRNDREKFRKKNWFWFAPNWLLLFRLCIVYGTLWGFQFSSVYFIVVVLKGSQ